MPNCVSLGRPLGGRPGGSPRTSMGWDMTHRGRHRSYQGRPRTPRGRPNCPADVHGTVDALWTQHGSSGSDGEDEAQDGESDSEAGEQEHQIIVNELLCYAFTYIDSAAPEMVIKSIEQFYTGDEIHAAKELLWQEYGKILKNTKSRSVGTAAAAEAEDIVLSGVMVIMNALVELPIKFCALNLRRVPRFSPEELNLQSIVNRLSVVELHMQQVREQTAHNSARLTVVEQDKGTGVPGGDPARGPCT